MKKLSLILTLLTGLLGCSATLKDYQNQNPKLDFENFFNGKLLAHGFFKDRFGKVKKTFTVDMETKWNNGIGILKEDFVYNDGTKSQRIWTLKKISNNKFSGTASDVEGEAIGEVVGNTLRWNYHLNLAVDDKTYRVYFDDWMYLIDESTMINQSYMSKFNIDLGEVVLSIRKIP